MSKHSMLTRSKLIDLNKKTRSGNSNGNHTDNKPDNDDIDEYGNIHGLIDYSCDEPIDIELIHKIQKSRNNKVDQITDIVLSSLLKQSSNKKKRKIKGVNNEKHINLVINDNRNNKNKNSDNKDKYENNDDIIVINQYDTDSSDIEINDSDSCNSDISYNSDVSYNSDISYNSEISYNSDISYKSGISDIDSIFTINDYEFKLDEYDEQYDEILESRNGKDSMEYFHSLSTDNKVTYLKQLKNIHKYNKNNIPLRFKILNSNMDLETKVIAINNIDTFDEMDTSSGEYYKMEQWINGLVKVPFGIYKQLSISDTDAIKDQREFFNNTSDILDKAIYGHYEAKTHILQLIGKWIKDPLATDNVLAIQGPMGNGKTTLVKEGICKALQRPFAFIALGGASDSSFFDGHNFTYEGSKWGRIVDILIQSKYMNPIIYFDELDKVSETYKGEEIIHLLTHLTDSSQNNCFHDNYFSGIDFDLSKVLFIFSFNDESKINKILKDRMTVINTNGFTIDEKCKISNNYLLPEILSTYKYNNKVIIDEVELKYIINNYTNNEEGVRNLKRCLDTLISKINMYELLEGCNNSNIKLPVIEDFKIPYNVTSKTIDNCLQNKEKNEAPSHMYL
ncbi:MAG: hypothetical protein CMG46_01765 [Candidatus Marinimicrobia bacterium]|nr:hypothetical protein [Candidatus Neomarinimicrobiota bacterium]